MIDASMAAAMALSISVDTSRRRLKVLGPPPPSCRRPPNSGGDQSFTRHSVAGDQLQCGLQSIDSVAIPSLGEQKVTQL